MLPGTLEVLVRVSAQTIGFCALFVAAGRPRRRPLRRRRRHSAEAREQKRSTAQPVGRGGACISVAPALDVTRPPRDQWISLQCADVAVHERKGPVDIAGAAATDIVGVGPDACDAAVLDVDAEAAHGLAAGAGAEVLGRGIARAVQSQRVARQECVRACARRGGGIAQDANASRLAVASGP
jgi:hypothetical protein